MTRPPPLLIATLSAPCLEAAKAEIETVARGLADVAEVRFDRWPRRELADASKLFPSPIPVLGTYRSRAEGGSGDDDVDSRAGILARLAVSGVSYLDVERRRDTAAAASIRHSQPTVTLVVSTHFTDEESSRTWEASVEPPEHGIAFTKVVFPCTIGRLLREVLPRLPAPDFPYVVHTTGPSGPLLRALGPRLGLAAVYAGPPADTSQPPVEPSQLPVDRLRWFFREAERAPLFAVVGHPVGHSRSPELHSRWMREDSRSGLYFALDVAEENEFLDLLPNLGHSGFRGLNVTHPHKTAALEASTESTARADACGCANLLTFEGEDVQADNTDVLAAARRLAELRNEGWSGDRVTVVGSGGAARATLAAARELRIERQVVARNQAKALELARSFDGEMWDGVGGPASLLVHATPFGHPHAGRLEVDLDRLVAPDSIVLDWVYGPESPDLADEVRRRGGRYEDGTKLLQYQAAASYEVWWGNAPKPRRSESSEAVS